MVDQTLPADLEDTRRVAFDPSKKEKVAFQRIVRLTPEDTRWTPHGLRCALKVYLVDEREDGTRVKRGVVWEWYGPPTGVKRLESGELRVEVEWDGVANRPLPALRVVPGKVVPSGVYEGDWIQVRGHGLQPIEGGAPLLAYAENLRKVIVWRTGDITDELINRAGIVTRFEDNRIELEFRTWGGGAPSGMGPKPAPPGRRQKKQYWIHVTRAASAAFEQPDQRSVTVNLWYTQLYWVMLHRLSRIAHRMFGGDLASVTQTLFTNALMHEFGHSIAHMTHVDHRSPNVSELWYGFPFIEAALDWWVDPETGTNPYAGLLEPEDREYIREFLSYLDGHGGNSIEWKNGFLARLTSQGPQPWIDRFRSWTHDSLDYTPREWYDMRNAALSK